jgi:hypothetical protein
MMSSTISAENRAPTMSKNSVKTTPFMGLPFVKQIKEYQWIKNNIPRRRSLADGFKATSP